MSWMQKLCEAYDACDSEVGKMPEDGSTPLLPLYHTSQQAYIQVKIDPDGNWCAKGGEILTGKRDRVTIMPCTPTSTSRTSSPDPHPLCDKLQYVAGDYKQWGAAKKYAYPAYLSLLSGWCASPYRHPDVCAVLTYLEKGCLIRDLADDGVLWRAPDGTIPAEYKGPKEDTPEIFKVCASQLDALVRFEVFHTEPGKGKLWADPSVWQSWIDYQNSLPGNPDICYVTGELMPSAPFSPKNIRRPGDGAKLISGNDTDGFTFRGRLTTAAQASCIGRVTTEKAHSALRWLIGKQAYSNGDQVILAWNAKKAQPKARLIAQDSLGDEEELFAELIPDKPVVSTGAIFADKLRKAAAGYDGISAGEAADSAVIGLDSATPGRLSVFYYREFSEYELVRRIAFWHSTCIWRHTYRTMQNGPKSTDRQRFIFDGAPAPRDIVEAAYGRNADDKLKKSTVERLLPCIVDGASLPKDLMLSAVRRATNAIALEGWEAEKTLSIACALVLKYYTDQNRTRKKEEVSQLIQDPYEAGKAFAQDRSYLFGRLLAYARKLEELAMLAAGNDLRPTNAHRMQVFFSKHPARAWKLLEEKLNPYLGRFMLSGERAGAYAALGKKYEQEMHDVCEALRDEFHDESLSPLYLLGYSTQLHVFDEERKERIAKNNPKQLEEEKAK